MSSAIVKDTRTFFSKGTVSEWEYVMTVYRDALTLKAQQKNKKPEELMKLDLWYQEELPKLIQSRKEKHITHDELVQTMKWKLSRGKWRPQLTDLVRLNMPSAVLQASRKAFKKLPNLAGAVKALQILKGVGPATASAVLAAGAPHIAPFMADECLMSIPEVESIDYTVQEYLHFTEKIRDAVNRLNSAEKDNGENSDNGTETEKNEIELSPKWTPHRVEMALWAHYIIRELNPSLLESMPQVEEVAAAAAQNGKSEASGNGSANENENENENEKENEKENEIKNENETKNKNIEEPEDGSRGSEDTSDNNNKEEGEESETSKSTPNADDSVNDDSIDEPASKKFKPDE